MLTIKEGNLKFEDYLVSLGFENSDKTKKSLYDKFSS
jgi:hypothetical protein